jgi:16S rRNA (uracil1498-N3)-methyltransferase
MRSGYVPVHPAQTLGAWCRTVDTDLKLVCALKTDKAWAWPAQADAVTILVGPEGGLGEQELVGLEAVGFLRWQIGARVMRTETAPIAALAW